MSRFVAPYGHSMVILRHDPSWPERLRIGKKQYHLTRFYHRCDGTMIWYYIFNSWFTNPLSRTRNQALESWISSFFGVSRCVVVTFGEWDQSATITNAPSGEAQKVEPQPPQLDGWTFWRIRWSVSGDFSTKYVGKSMEIHGKMDVSIAGQIRVNEGFSIATFDYRRV